MNHLKPTMRSMTMKSHCLSIVLAAWGCFGAQASGPVAFEDLKAVFKKHCLTCHNSERPRGGLDMTTKAAILAGSDSGVAVAPGKPEDSLLFRLASHLDAPHMPPNSPKMPDRDLELVKIWIKLGLPERKDISKLDPKLLATLDKDNRPMAGNAAMSASPMDSGAGKTVASNASGAREAVVANPAVASKTQETAKASRVAVTGLAWSEKLGGFLRPVAGGVALVDEKGNLQRTFPFPEKEITKIRVSHDGQTLLIAGGEGAQTGRVNLVNAADGSKRFETAEELDTVLAGDLKLAQGSNGSGLNQGLVALGGPSKVVKVFSLADGKMVYAMKKHIDWVLDIRFSPDGLLLASCDRSGTILVTEAATGAEVLVLRGHTGAVTTLAWRPEGNALISGGADGKVRVWDAHFGKDLGVHDAHDGGVNQVEVLADGRILSAGRDKTIKLWSPALDRSEVAVTTSKNPLALATKPGTIVVGESDGKLSWVSLDSKRLAAPANLVLASKKDESALNQSVLNQPGSPMAQTNGAGAVEMSPVALERKRDLLKTLEATAEKLKDDAARTPENKDLSEGYIQLCRTILALKGEIVRLEKSTLPVNQGSR